MTRIPSWLLLIFPGALVVLSGAAISAQDKYALQVPGGLAFSEFVLSDARTIHHFARAGSAKANRRTTINKILLVMRGPNAVSVSVQPRAMVRHLNVATATI
jgi:hypothetical protein